MQPLGGKLLILLLLLCANIGLQLLAPQILRNFIDVAQAHGPQRVLTNAALTFLGVALLNQGVYAALNYLSVAVGWTATNALRADLAAHCLHLDMSFHTVHLPGAMIERIDGDVSTLSNFFSQFVMRIVGSALLLLGILSLLLWEDWRLGLLMASFTIVTLLVVKRLQGRGVPYVNVWRQGVADTVAFWEERLDGLEDIRANGAQAYTLQQHHRLHYALLRSGRTAIIMGRIVIHTWELLSSVGTAALFAYAAYLMHAGTLTIGTVYLVFHYTQLVAGQCVVTNAKQNYERQPNPPCTDPSHSHAGACQLRVYNRQADFAQHLLYPGAKQSSWSAWAHRQWQKHAGAPALSTV